MNFNIAKKGKKVGCKLNEFKVESGGEVFQKSYTVAERERWGKRGCNQRVDGSDKQGFSGRVKQ